MEIPGISSGDTIFGATSTTPQNELGEDSFMKLLVTQLQNQDPLEPMANEDYIAQLATFSSLEELETLNDSVVAMVALQQSNAVLDQLTSSSALIGQTVTYTDPLTGDVQSGVVDSAKLLDGIAVLSIGGQDVPLALVTEVQGVIDDGAGA
jgi:flagellar basal-body rod modification protein FlgD